MRNDVPTQLEALHDLLHAACAMGDGDLRLSDLERPRVGFGDWVMDDEPSDWTVLDSGRGIVGKQGVNEGPDAYERKDGMP